MKRLIYIFPFLFAVACNLSPGFEDLTPGKKEVKLVPHVYINHFSDELSECSGLIWFNSSLWTLNDSGGKNEIYRIGNDGAIEERVSLNGVRNTDWESMAQDEDYIYVGDFGNSNGNRSELKIYRISKEDLDSEESEIDVTPQAINFFYAEQEDYSLKQNATEYDCEAMVTYGDYIYLISKDWVNNKSKVYELDKKPGNYELYPVDSFEVNGLISGADISDSGEYLALVGHRSYGNPFVLLFKFSQAKTFSEKFILFELTSLLGTRLKSICFKDQGEIVIATQATNDYAQQAFLFSYDEYLNHFY